jgi:hypothetical protein
MSSGLEAPIYLAYNLIVRLERSANVHSRGQFQEISIEECVSSRKGLTRTGRSRHGKLPYPLRLM